MAGSDLKPHEVNAVPTVGEDGYPVFNGFTDKLRSILDAIATDEATTAQACKAVGLNPMKFWALRRAHPIIDEAYITAMELGGEAMHAKALEAADNATPETAQCDRLRFDAYRWSAGKRYARVYGDRAGQLVVTQTVNVGSIGEAIRAAVEARRLPQVLDVDPNTGEVEKPKGKHK